MYFLLASVFCPLWVLPNFVTPHYVEWNKEVIQEFLLRWLLVLRALSESSLIVVGSLNLLPFAGSFPCALVIRVMLSSSLWTLWAYSSARCSSLFVSLLFFPPWRVYLYRTLATVHKYVSIQTFTTRLRLGNWDGRDPAQGRERNTGRPTRCITCTSLHSVEENRGRARAVCASAPNEAGDLLQLAGNQPYHSTATPRVSKTPRLVAGPARRRLVVLRRK